LKYSLKSIKTYEHHLHCHVYRSFGVVFLHWPNFKWFKLYGRALQAGQTIQLSPNNRLLSSWNGLVQHLKYTDIVAKWNKSTLHSNGCRPLTKVSTGFYIKCKFCLVNYQQLYMALNWGSEFISVVYYLISLYSHIVVICDNLV
jgi:hypothetical protein